jgi:DNA-binding GntR family transcriptional regulator
VSESTHINEALSQALPALSASSTLPSRLHEVLESAIITGAFSPGQRIHADEIAAIYGVSRIPVREAMRSLHQDGWVEIRPRYGVRVRERSEAELIDLFEFRAEVESSQAGFAAKRRTSDDLAAMRAVTQQSAVAREELDYAELDACASRFYAALRVAAHNTVMARESASLEKRAKFYFSTVADQLGVDWTYVHDELLQHVEAQDVEAAQALARHHILNTGTAVQNLLF